MVAIFWLAAYKRPRTTMTEWMVIAAVIVILIGLLLPAFDEAREYSRARGCRHHLQDLSQALRNHAAAAGALPQAITYDASDRPFYSWRVSVLPSLDQQALFGKFNPNEPWDGPGNHALAILSVSPFVCYSNPNSGLALGQTSYFAIVGDQTAWPLRRGLPVEEITDGLEDTILVLECHGLDVPWSKPRDLSLDEAVAVLAGLRSDQLAHPPYEYPGYFYRKPSLDRLGVHAAFADGEVRFLPVPLPEDMAKALLTANAGDHVDWDEFERLTSPQLDYAKIYATIAFAIVALWPARRAFRKRSVLAPDSSSRG
ncbi:DUF1559 domain-containing protein [Lacipirellula sp.]|uniref:DUF1559 family PulG-like putative transporter n=1 Tax=Lacipirellula sp. TaxID=2691419 RepID=UPI003D0EB5C9